MLRLGKSAQLTSQGEPCVFVHGAVEKIMMYCFLPMSAQRAEWGIHFPNSMQIFMQLHMFRMELEENTGLCFGGVLHQPQEQHCWEF